MSRSYREALFAIENALKHLDDYEADMKREVERLTGLLDEYTTVCNILAKRCLELKPSMGHTQGDLIYSIKRSLKANETGVEGMVYPHSHYSGD